MKHYGFAAALMILSAIGATNAYAAPIAAQTSQRLTDESSYTYSLVVWLNNGESASYKVSTQPVVTYSEGNFLVNSTEANITYAASDVNRFTMDREANGSGVESISASNTVTPGSLVTAYSADGKIVATWNADENGSVNYNLNSLAAGVYIIKTEKSTVKILKK